MSIAKNSRIERDGGISFTVSSISVGAEQREDPKVDVTGSRTLEDSDLDAEILLSRMEFEYDYSKERDYTGTQYIPIFVMLPVSILLIN